MYKRITYSSPEEYSKLSFWEAKHAEYKPSAAYWARRKKAITIIKMPVEDKAEKDELQVMITQLMQEHVQRVQRLTEEEVQDVYAEMRAVFQLIGTDFSIVHDKYSYLSLFRRFYRDQGINIGQAIQELQQHFGGRFRVYFNTAYELVDIVTQKHQRFVRNTHQLRLTQ